MATDYELTFADYLSIVRRRAPYLIGIFVVVMLVAVKVAVSIPHSYRSTGTILVESPLVAENSVPGAVRNDLDERIEILKQRAMTRENLLDIINKYGLFKGRPASMSTSDLLKKMRERITVEPVSSRIGGRGLPTIAFTISFDDHRPELALQVDKDLISRFLHLNQRESMRARAESDLFDVEQNIKRTSDQLSTLQAELSGVSTEHKDLSEKSPPPMVLSAADEENAKTLQQLKAEYIKLSATYTQSYPDVIELKRRIAALEKAPKVRGRAAPTAQARRLSSVTYLTQAKVRAAASKLDSLKQQKKMLQEKISRFAHSADPESGASEGQTERFSLLEPPILPDRPFKPNRLKIIAMGFFFALALSGGTVAALESIDKRIRGSEALGNVLGGRPLVTIPYLSTRAEEVRRRKMLKWGLVAAVIALIVVLVIVHFLIMPLDVLLAKILARLP